MVRRGRRAGAWSPPLVAAMARSLAREERREAGRLTALADRARLIHEAGYAAEFTEASAATAAVAATVEAADLFWVAAPMARLAGRLPGRPCYQRRRRAGPGRAHGHG